MDRQFQRLAVLHANAVRTLDPSGFVQKLFRLVRVVGEEIAVIRGSRDVALDEGHRELPVLRIDCVDDFLTVDACLKCLTHLHIIIGLKLGVDGPAVDEAEITRGRDGEAFLFERFQFLGRGVVRDIRLTGLNGGDAKGWLRDQLVGDGIEIGGAGVADCGGTPIIVLALDQGDVVALFPGLHHIGSAAGGLAEVRLLAGRLGNGLGRDQDGAVVAKRRNEPERGLLEENLDRRRINRFGVIIGLGEEADRVDALVLAAGIPDVEIGNYGLGIQRFAIGESHAAFEVEGELRRGVVLLPALGNPRADLAFGIDVQQLIRDMTPYVALETGDRAVVGDPRVAQGIDQKRDVTAIMWRVCGHSTQRCSRR